MEQKSGFRKTLRFVNRLGISSLFLGIVAALIKAWATYWLGPGQGPVQPPEKLAAVSETKLETVEDLLKTSPVSLMDWQINVEQSGTPAQRERLFRNYIGKHVVWEGYFDQFNIVKDAVDDAHGCVLILHENRAALYEKRLLGPPSIRCWMPRQIAGELKKLQRGDWIVVRGQLADPSLAGSLLCTDLHDCELIAARAVRAVEMALDDSETVIR